MGDRLNWDVVGDPSWLQWAITAPLLWMALAGHGWAVPLVAGMCVVTTVHYWLRHRSWRPFPVQIRLGFLLVLLATQLPGMGWLLWLPALGTAAQVVMGYCPMARFLKLMPWNRDGSEGFGPGLVRSVVFAAPGNDGLIDWHRQGGLS